MPSHEDDLEELVLEGDRLHRAMRTSMLPRGCSAEEAFPLKTASQNTNVKPYDVAFAGGHGGHW